MPDPFRLLCVLAHPDDEALGAGGILARYAAEGIETHLITATLGERGRIGKERPGAEVAAPIRRRELERAAAILGVSHFELLGYRDGELDRVDPAEVTARLAAQVRQIRPDVVVTFGADGAYGHVDHVAISQWTGAALMAAADPSFRAPRGIELPSSPHRASKLYWLVWSPSASAAYQRAFGELRHRADGVERRAVSWPDWSITTVLDATAHWRTVWSAVRCHESQLAGREALGELPEERHVELWGRPTLYRVWSLVNGGRDVESDLFAGLREPAAAPAGARP